MRLGQTVPHQHQALPLTTESLADHSINFLNYTTALSFPYLGHVYNALTVMSLAPLFVNVSPAYIPNVVSRPTRVDSKDVPLLLAEAIVVYKKACEVYFEAEDAYKDKIAKTMAARPVDEDD